MEAINGTLKGKREKSKGRKSAALLSVAEATPTFPFSLYTSHFPRTRPLLTERPARLAFDYAPDNSTPVRPSSSTITASADLAIPTVAASSRVADFKELLKPGISAFVVVTGIAGYLLGAPAGIDWLVLLGLIAGTALTAGGSGALNHVVEWRHDAKMERTKDRPIPTGRITAGVGLAYGLTLLGVGLVVAASTTNLLTVILALTTAVLYIAVYTPLKRVTAHNTFVGAIPGALPILGGYTAATGTFGPIGWVVFAILFLWQLPHFYALAWKYRDDYAAGGFVMLPNVDPTGKSTGRNAVIASLLLLVAGMLPTALGAAGWVYLVGMMGIGTAFTIPAFSFLARPTNARARRLMLTSLLYVPMFFALVVIDFLLR